MALINWFCSLSNRATDKVHICVNTQCKIADYTYKNWTLRTETQMKLLITHIVRNTRILSASSNLRYNLQHNNMYGRKRLCNYVLLLWKCQNREAVNRKISYPRHKKTILSYFTASNTKSEAEIIVKLIFDDTVDLA